MLNKHKWYLGLTGKVVILSSLLSGCGGGSDDPDPQPVPTPPANVAPVANAGDDISADEYETVELSVASSTDSDGSIASYSWNFGDGYTSSQQNPTHNYSSAGSYSVSLTVVDNQGAHH